jgi:hypothetical protein
MDAMETAQGVPIKRDTTGAELSADGLLSAHR